MDQYAVHYLQTEVREHVVADIVSVAQYHARRHANNHGHFSTPRQVFCLVDHLGYLAYGETSSISAARFIREHFPERYGPLAELVHAMWRHGTVHQFRPYGYVDSSQDDASRQVWWLTTNHNRKAERRQHMLVYPVPHVSNAVYVVVNCCQLADDLLLAVDRLISRIETGDFDAEPLMARIATVRKPQQVDGIKAGAAAKQILREQIALAWESSGGRLDAKLNVVEQHPEAAQ
ncbi:MAG: hypothetical protein Q7V14_05285 [Coriobacteriia bacterium]|nr:hypothetical protein [Coriobacteriia bacterium]